MNKQADTRVSRAGFNDFAELERLEKLCFSESIQSSKRSLRLSLHSKHQMVFFIEIRDDKKWRKIGALILYIYKKSLRIYSICIDPQYRKSGIGASLVNYAIKLAIRKGFSQVSLEVDQKKEKLVSWYKQFGFVSGSELFDYYGEGMHAYRMSLAVDSRDISLKKT